MGTVLAGDGGYLGFSFSSSEGVHGIGSDLVSIKSVFKRHRL